MLASFFMSIKTRKSFKRTDRFVCFSLSPVLKNYGQQLKAPAAMVRLRLYETLLLLPPQTFEGSYTHLLRMLVSEFTLTENPGNTTTSLLRVVCNANDSVILGTWLQETDHRTIEDQVCIFLSRSLYNFFTWIIFCQWTNDVNIFDVDQKRKHIMPVFRQKKKRGM